MSCSKILYLVGQYPAFNHTYILREVRELRKLGWDIEVASIRPDTRPLAQLTAEEREERSHAWSVTTCGVSGALHAHLVSLTMQPRSYFRGLAWVLRLGGFNLVNIVRNWIYFTEALIVGQWMQPRGFTHIHIHFASTVGLLIAKTFPITISITVHGPAEFADPASFHLREKIESAEFICAISKYGHGELMKSCDSNQWGKLETVPLGIDPDAFAPTIRPPAGRSSFDVVSVGRLSSEKAQRVLIDAVARLVHDGRQVRLRLVGDGPDRPALEKHIVASGLSEIVRLDGVLNQDQLKTLYQKSDVFALASLAEGVPVVLMEAMAMGIPCVATRITGIPELIEHGQDGLLVPPSDVLQLSAALAQLMDEPLLRERIAKAGRSKVIEKYNLSKNALLLAKVFEKRVSVLPKQPRGAQA